MLQPLEFGHMNFLLSNTEKMKKKMIIIRKGKEEKKRKLI